jgi:hypothetical protein
MATTGEASLSDLLFGTPLHKRGEGEDQAIHSLDPAIRGILSVLQRELGPDDNHPCSQALLEWSRIPDLPLDYDGVAARRAALLFALWRERDVQAHYRVRDPALVDDLCNRILPLVGPRFLANQAQSPDVFTVFVSVLSSMWAREDMGATEPRAQVRDEEAYDELAACEPEAGVDQ